jgi:hypothetical protein
MIIKDQNKFLVENAGLKNENDSLRVDLTILEYEKEQLLDINRSSLSFIEECLQCS